MTFKPSVRLFKLITHLTLLLFCSSAFGGYKVFLDPRSMAMGGTGVAAATKFNASAHNPALIAFNRGNQPDKIYININSGQRQLYGESLNEDILEMQNSDLQSDFTEGVADNEDIDTLKAKAKVLTAFLKSKNLTSYRADEMNAFSLLVDTDPITINFFTRREQRDMTVFRDKDSFFVDNVFFPFYEDPANSRLAFSNLDANFISSVDTTHFDWSEMGATVATTNVIDYNMPISWGFTPKLIQYHAAHVATQLEFYDINVAPATQSSDSNLEWNLDVGFAILFTDSFLREEFGLDGWWLEGEWVFGLVGMNLFPTDISTPVLGNDRILYPGKKPAVQALYQVGLAHYREDYMITLDIDLTEDETFNFEGNRRFISFGTEYYLRDDFHLRGGARFNISRTTDTAKEDHSISAGFLWQPRGFTIEAAAMISEVEVGGSIGFGLAF